MDEGSVLSVEGVGGSFHCRHECAVYSQPLNRAAVDVLHYIYSHVIAWNCKS